MKAKCKRCGDTIEVTRLREYKTCKCGAIGLDYGDGYYFRVCGNPENFDGEVKGIPRIKDIERISDIDSMEPGSTITIDGHKMTVKKCVNKNRDGLASIDLSSLGEATVSDPDLETLSNYYADIANCFERLANDFSHLSKVMEDRNERYGESHK